ncbi:MAG: hypothetical protein A2Y76_14505 [Planctomycetes bacterium RBG_13_60_9]|nr:MAG: hypothetical protein A2Y76_14505 [Planctomycetes bacterium RBG_13_60_9]
MRAVLLTLVTCLFVLPAQAKYSGGSIITSYSSGSVSGTVYGGLVGWNGGPITSSFWDIQTSGWTTGTGGTGKTTAEMQMAQTFLDAGWDFVDEVANGTEDIWWILEGKDYPRLWWEAAPADIRSSNLEARNKHE